MILKIHQDIRKLGAMARRLRPAQSPGILTNTTTSGTTQKPIIKANDNSGSGDSKSFIPRWG